METSALPDLRPARRCCVVLPTYDEADGIAVFLDRLLAATAGGDVDVLVVDDNSPDGTADVVRSHPAHGGRVRLLQRPGKEGLGVAYRAGFAHAVAVGYQVVVQMDADGSHSVEDLLPMIAGLDSADVVVGSRYVAGGATRGWPWTRRALSAAANLYARAVLRLRTHDATAGFRAWRSSAVHRAGLLATTSNGYGFQVESTWRAERSGLRVREHPIVFTDRTTGASKMDGAVAVEAFLSVARWRLGELTRHAGRGTSVAVPLSRP